MSDAVLSQFTPTAEIAETAPQKELRIGLIGTGWIAEAYAEVMKTLPGAKFVAAADLIPGKAEKFMERFGFADINFYPDHKSMLEAEELDAVYICTYNATHAECTIDALNRGVHVLLENRLP